MKGLLFLKVAYVVAWLIYLGYLAQILLRMKKVTAEREELQRGLAAPARREIIATEPQRR